jgi:hypothetical protein
LSGAGAVGGFVAIVARLIWKMECREGGRRLRVEALSNTGTLGLEIVEKFHRVQLGSD